MKKRVLSTILVICLAAGLTTPAMAASYTPFGGSTTATIDGITYSDVFGAAGRDISEPSAFYTTALNSGSPGLREYWTNLSQLVLLSNTDVFESMTRPDLGGGLQYNSSGNNLNKLTIAKSLSAAESAIRGIYGVNDDCKLTSLADNTAEQTVLYFVQEFYRNHDLSPIFVENKFAVATIFYDFKLSYLNMDGELASAVSGCDTVEDAKTQNAGTNNFTYNESNSGQSYISGIKNQSASEIVATQAITNSQSLTVGSSMESTKEYGFSEMIGSETMFTAKIPFVGGIEETVKLEFTASQTFSSTQGSSTENSQSQSVENSLQMAMPPHTEVVLQQNVSDINMQINYDYPVAISYKVKTIGLTISYFNGSSINGYGTLSELATFGRSNQNHSTAVDNLYNRYINRNAPGYEESYGDGIDWDTALARFKTALGGAFGSSIDLGTTTERLYHNRPMSVTGGVLSVGSKGISSKVYGINPLYPLSTVKPDGAYDYDMTTGDRFYVDNIPITGFNASGVPYYGFSSDYGRWILVDEAGRELHDSDIASLQTNPITGNTHLVAGSTDGTVYLKYLIDENVYSYSNNIGSYTKNSNLAQTAAIQVNVSQALFDGEINISGSLTGYAGDPAINLDDCNLDVLVTDSTGKELARSIVWEAQELPVRGILVRDNNVSFTKAGTFHIRAVTGDIKSRWIEVSALPERALDSLEIADNNSPSILDVDIKNGSAVIDLENATNFITVRALDQYGSDWPDISKLEWKCDDANVSISGSSLTVDTDGSYEIYAEIGGIKSNALNLTVRDSSPVVNTIAAQMTEMPSSGGSNTITVTGENLPDTVIVAAFDAAGDEMVRASAAGSEKQQAATLDFPQNTVADKDATYIVKFSFDGAAFEDVPTVSVNVSVVTYTVAFDSQGGSDIDPITGVTFGSTVTKPADPSKEGYTFTGWYCDEALEQAYDFTKKVAGDMKLYAGWELNEYTITFHSNGGSAVGNQTISHGGTVAKPADPSKEGYTFTGWYSDEAMKQTYDFTGKVTGDMKLFAGWAAIHSAYISGYPDSTFGPDNSLTRAEAAMMFYNLALGAPFTSAGNSSTGLTDIKKGAWYYDAVMYLEDLGIIAGYPNDTFLPEATITRAEFTTMAMKYAKLEASTTASGFPDVPNSHWAAGYIAAAKDLGYAMGYPNGNFGPEDEMTRAQAVTILNRIMTRDAAAADFTGLEMPFNDVPESHWAYHQIMEAAVAHPGH